MRKIICVFFIICFLFSFSACHQNDVFNENFLHKEIQSAIIDESVSVEVTAPTESTVPINYSASEDTNPSGISSTQGVSGSTCSNTPSEDNRVFTKSSNVFIQYLEFSDSEKYGYAIDLQKKQPIENNLIEYSETARNVIKTLHEEALNAQTKGLESYAIDIPRLNCEDTRAIVYYFWTYYGHDSDLNTLLAVTNTKDNTKIEIDLNVLSLFEEERVTLYKRIDDALSQMEDGDDKYLLYQISEYICDLITYTNGYRNVHDAFDGRGVCGVYSLLFKMMAERVGIPVEIVTGYRTTDAPGHAWNRVKINDEYLYYDITSLDGELGKNYMYIQSSEDLHEDYIQFFGVFYVHMGCVYGEC